MKKKYLLNGKVYDEDVILGYAQKSGLSLSDYLTESGATEHKETAVYELNGKGYDSTTIKAYADKSGLSVNDYMKEAGVKKKEDGATPATNGSQNGAPQSGIDPSKYETKLNPSEEKQFQSWFEKQHNAGRIAPGDYDFYKKNGYGLNYDFRAAFKNNENAAINPTDNDWHWSDIGKKPNHPTFSDGSKYNGVDGNIGGRFEGEKFIPPSKKSSQFGTRDILNVKPSISLGANEVSRNPYASIINATINADIPDDRRVSIYKEAVTNKNVQPLVDLVNEEKNKLTAKKEDFKLNQKDNSTGAELYDNDIVLAKKQDEYNKTFEQDDERLKSLQQQAAKSIDRVMSDKLLEKKGADILYSTKEIGDERRKMRSAIGEEPGYADEVGNLSAEDKLKDKFAFGMTFDGKEKRGQQQHDYLNEAGIYKAALENIGEQLEELDKNENVQKWLSAKSEAEFNELGKSPEAAKYRELANRGKLFYDRFNQLPLSYPRVLWQQRRQQLADAWAKKVVGDDVIAGVPGMQGLRELRKVFVGDKPSSEEDYKELADATGIPLEDVKDIITTEGDFGNIGIPSRLGRILNSAVGVIDSSIEGINRLAYDKNEANVINNHLEKMRYTPSPELTKDWSVSRVIDTMSDGLGQFAGFAVGSELLGAPLAGAAAATEGLGVAAELGQSVNLLKTVPNIIKSIEKARSIGSTFATGYLSSLESAYQYAATQTDDESKRWQYANSDAIANGASELLLRDVDVAEKILKGKPIEDILRSVAGKKIPFSTADVLKARIGEFAKVLGYESAEELIPYFTDVFQKDNIFGNKMSTAEIMNGAVDTIVQTAISTVPMGAFSASSVPTKRVMESALLEAAKTPEYYSGKFDDMFSKGLISEQDKDKSIKIVNTVADIYNKLPDQLPNGRILSDQDKGAIVNLQLGKRQLENLKENVDESLYPSIDDELKNKNKQVADIISNVTTLSKTEAAQPKLLTPEEVETKLTTTIPGDKKSDAVSFVNEMADGEIIPTLFREQAVANPLTFLQTVADQALGYTRDSEGNRVKSTDAVDPNVASQYSETVVDYAKELFPEQTQPAELKTLEENRRLDNELYDKRLAELPKEPAATFEVRKENVEKERKESNDYYDSRISELEKQTQNESTIKSQTDTGDQQAKLQTNEAIQSDERTGEVVAGPETQPAERPVSSGVAVVAPSSQPQNTETRRGVTVMTPQTEVDKMVNRLAKGEDLSSPEDLEFYQNNATEIESRLRDKLKEEAEEDVVIPTPEEEERTRISDALFAFADKIRKANLTGSGGTAAMTNLFKIPQEILGRAIQAVAVAVKGGELFTDAIKKGIDIIREAGHQVAEDDFTGLVNSLSRGEKPKAGKVRATSIAIDAAVPSDKEFSVAMDGNEPADPIAAYHMTRAPEITKMFGADKTQQNVFDSLPSEERFRAQMEMLQDGKSLMAAAQSMFGSTDVNVYGRQLFRYIQDMPGQDAGLTNKRAVMLATLLGEIKQAVLTNKNPDIQGELQQLDRVVSAYYNKFMHVTAKNLSAARLLRLFRDKYMADIFHDKILEEKQIKERNAITEDEADTEISDEDALAHQEKPRQKPDVKDQQKNRTQKQAEADRRKKSPKTEFDRIASEKEDDIKKKYGGKNKLIDTIIEKIKKLNCK